MNTDELVAHFERVTRGFTVEKKAAVWAEIRRTTMLSSPGALAALLDERTKQTPALAHIDKHLIDAEEGRARGLVISLGPQEGKSSKVARYGVLWALLRNPERRVAIASYAESLATGHSRFVRDLIDTHGATAPLTGGRDLLGLRLNPASHAASRWDLEDHGGGVIAAGVGGGLTGKPVDWMVIDDPFKDRAEADSLVTRNAVWDWYTDVVLARGPKVIILIMTRWHEDDLVGRILEADRALPKHLQRFRVVNISAQCEDPTSDALGRQAGEYLVSARDGSDGTAAHDAAYYEERKRNARTWAALYQGHPTPLEGGMFQWEWIRPYRIPPTDVPHLARVVVAVDPTGGGHDEAGIIAAGRDTTRRTYVLADHSGAFSAGGQYRAAWLAVLDHQADVLVYESNLVDPIMRKAIPSAWRRMRDQARALDAAGVLLLDLDDVDEQVLDERLARAAQSLAGGGDDDVTASDDPLAALTRQLTQLIPYAPRVLAAPESGPARVEGVRATRGKAIRADPVSQAYETGRVHHAGVFPALEQELVTWQEGQDSPNRLDALVWAVTYLDVGSQPGRIATAAGRGRVAIGAAAAGRSGSRTGRR